MSQNQLATSAGRKTFLNLVEGAGFKSQLALALPRHITADRILRICLTSMNKVPLLYECTPESVMAGIMQAAQMGLEIDGKKAALVPFKDNRSGTRVATLIIGYQGFIELAYRHPKVQGVRANVVYAKDHFEYDEGLNPKLIHTPFEGDEDPGQIRKAYAICSLEGGGAAFKVIGKRDIEKAKQMSRSSGNADSPWKQHEAAMWMKTAVRRLAPFMPQSSEMTEALTVDADSNRVIDIGGAMMPGAFGSATEPASEPKTITEMAQAEAEEASEGEPPESSTASADTKPEPEKKPEPKPAKKADPKEALLKKLTEASATRGRVLEIAKERELMPEKKWADVTDEEATKILEHWDNVILPELRG